MPTPRHTQVHGLPPACREAEPLPLIPSALISPPNGPSVPLPLKSPQDLIRAQCRLWLFAHALYSNYLLSNQTRIFIFPARSLHDLETALMKFPASSRAWLPQTESPAPWVVREELLSLLLCHQIMPPPHRQCPPLIWYAATSPDGKCPEHSFPIMVLHDIITRCPATGILPGSVSSVPVCAFERQESFLEITDSMSENGCIYISVPEVMAFISPLRTARPQYYRIHPAWTEAADRDCNAPPQPVFFIPLSSRSEHSEFCQVPSCCL